MMGYVLEVYVSFHSDDENWYGNPPNEYINAYNLTDKPGNGPFREVIVRLNGDEIGAVWPFTVVFTGGFNPLTWRPITAIGSFDLPSYDIEIKPFLGKILDGKQHEFGFGVTNALNEWYIDANLHIWLDHESDTTIGELIRNENPPSKISLVSKNKGSYITSAIRSFSVSVWVKSSHGNITTNSFQDFSFTNRMTLSGSSEIVNQTIDASSRVYTIVPSSFSYIYMAERYQNFPLYFHTEEVPLGHGNHTLLSYVSLGINEKRLAGSSSSPLVSSILNNSQQGQGVLNFSGNLITGGLGSAQQVYHLDGSAECYFWNVSSSNYTILYNISALISIMVSSSAAAAVLFILCLLTNSFSSSHGNLFFPWKSETPLTKYFEVTKPIKIPPKAKPCASLLVLQHDFGYTYGKSPVLVNYEPPTNCPSKHFSRIVLESESTAKGIQFDRIFGI
ncbi:hypothetical protein C5167_012952 [Papaver somniferum]|uniref:Peptide N-acetyl-beta-D-glucosaminyl asparaginase amidase A N-terminal domain-containing protein n=1 Tax=Papaver somniferum TaxID=3469 RepID=A0A4Y7IYZ5_PAPSO|nr:hypothetical protein C5167_012952 [Papaver somniferum]